MGKLAPPKGECPLCRAKMGKLAPPKGECPLCHKPVYYGGVPSVLGVEYYWHRECLENFKKMIQDVEAEQEGKE